ncbi:MAG: protoheme IX farnesyltransferase [Saprospirales bacterium]|nr:protoheme IX farnesyltransferase [Saprospirales bacterium]MBK8490454.1 protoheme IX farnesyltransferase [Saprospirales bacterium]
MRDRREVVHKKISRVTRTRVVAGSISWVSQKVTDYKLLVKFRLTLTVVFSALMAFFIASKEDVQLAAVVVLALGGFFVTGAANALNQVLEKDYDKLMKRTADRPLAAGRMTVSEAVLAAGLMAMVGIMLLALFNVWAAFFGMLSLVAYAFLYTPLKRYSPMAIPVGAVPGALPMLIGCVAAQGELTMLAFALFSIQFAWQFPHFWSIGWLGYDDYRIAGYKMLPERAGERDPNTGLYAAGYALILIPLGFSLPWLGVTGMTSAIFMAVLSLVYAALGWNLYRKQDRKAALKLMFGSLLYLPLILVAFYLDKAGAGF